MWRTTCLALLAWGGSAQAGFWFDQTWDHVPGIPHFRVVNVFATNDGYSTGAGIWAIDFTYTGDATVWSQRTTAIGLDVDILNTENVPWGSVIRLGNQSTELIAASPARSHVAWTEGITAFSVLAYTPEQNFQPRQQIAQFVFANDARYRMVGRIGGSQGPAFSFDLVSPFGSSEHFPAPEPPFTLKIDRPVKVINHFAPGATHEFRPVTVLSVSRDPGQEPPPISLESISPQLLDNIEWLTDEPTRKVFRLVNLSAEDWQLGTIVFSSASGLSWRNRETFTLIAPEPATAGVLGLLIGLGTLRTRRS
jgi:hypothetical protein